MDGGRIAAEGSPAAAHPRVVDPRGRRAALPARRERDGRREDRGAGTRRRPRGPGAAGRGAARPRPALLRRRRRGQRRPYTAAVSSRCRCSCAGRRSRTSSCGSPAARWSTDDRPTSTSRRRAPPSRTPCSADLRDGRSGVRLLADAIPPHLARHGDLDGARSRSGSSPPWGSGSAPWSTTAPARRSLDGVELSRLHRARACSRPRPCRRPRSSRPSRCSARSSGSGSTTRSSRPRCASVDILAGHLLFVALRLVDHQRRCSSSSWLLFGAIQSPLGESSRCRSPS